MPVGTRVLGRGLTLASTARATLPCPETDDILLSHPVCHSWRWENERQCCKQPSIKWNSKLEKKRKEDQARPVSLMGFWGCGAGLCTARRRDTVVRPHSLSLLPLGLVLDHPLFGVSGRPQQRRSLPFIELGAKSHGSIPLVTARNEIAVLLPGGTPKAKREVPKGSSAPARLYVILRLLGRYPRFAAAVSARLRPLFLNAQDFHHPLALPFRSVFTAS